MADRRPSEVVLLHDNAYGPEGIDYDVWLSTVSCPLTMVSEDGEYAFDTIEAVETQLRAVEKAARSDGIVKLRTRIVGEVEVGAGIAIVSTHRDRLTVRGRAEGVIGSTPITWTLRKTDTGWKIQRIFFEGARYEHLSRRLASDRMESGSTAKHAEPPHTKGVET